jgi:cell wall-associated NlpC family hydrolase
MGRVGRVRGSTLPVVLGAALVAGILGLGGSAVLPASADNGSPDPSSAPLLEGGGSLGGPPADSSKAPAAGASDAEPPLQEGGGNLPGQKPGAQLSADGLAAEDVVADPRTSDAAPPIDPNFVDQYGKVWKQVESDKKKNAKTVKQLATARRMLAVSYVDMQSAVRERGRSDATLAAANEEFGLSVRDFYITGTTDVDVVLGVLGSKPEDVLRNIDSFMYLRSQTSSKGDEYVAAQQTWVAAQSAAAQAMIRMADDDDRVMELLAALTSGRKKLAKDQAELQRLVAVAAPQTVISKDGCPKAVLDGTVPVDVKVKKLCENAVKHAPTPQAAVAIKWALIRLGAPYACEGIGRLEAWRYDCSSYVSRAYFEGAGLRTAGKTWAPSTRNMVPWDGVPLDQHYAPIPPSELKPGDLVLYDTCPAGQTCPYRHVVMYLGPMAKDGVPMMAHTNGCGLVAHVEPFTGTDALNFLGVRRVMALPGEKIQTVFSIPKKLAKKAGLASSNKPAKPDKAKKN